MNLQLLNPYQIIEALKEENELVKAENEQLKKKIAEMKEKEGVLYDSVDGAGDGPGTE